MTGPNWILKNYLLKCSGYKLMFLVQNVLLSLWLWSAEHFEWWMGEVVKFPSAPGSKWVHSAHWEAALQFPPAQEDLHHPCSGVTIWTKHQHLDGAVGQCLGWMESLLKSGMRLLTSLGSKSQDWALPREKYLWEGLGSPLPLTASSHLVYVLQPDGK